MAAPTTAARVKKALANPEPSTHGGSRTPSGSAGSRNACLIDHLVSGGQQCLWDGDAERPRGLEVNGQFKLSRLLNRQIGGASALEDSIDEPRGWTKRIVGNPSVGDQAAFVD